MTDRTAQTAITDATTRAADARGCKLDLVIIEDQRNVLSNVSCHGRVTADVIIALITCISSENSWNNPAFWMFPSVVIVIRPTWMGLSPLSRELLSQKRLCQKYW